MAVEEHTHARVGVRLGRFVGERFLPIPQLVLVVVLAAAGAGVAVTAAGTDAAWRVWPVANTLALMVLFFFHLRVMDDAKDAAHDRIHEPDRPVARGLVSVRELDVLTGLLLAAQAAIAALLGSAVVTVWALAAAYTLLMRVEFFAPAAMERRIMVFLVSHVASLVPIWALAVTAGAAALLGTAGADTALTFAGSGWLLAMALFLGLGFEMGRKLERYVAAHAHRAIFLWAAVAPAAAATAAIGTARLGMTLTAVALALVTGLVLVGHVTVAGRVLTQGADPSRLPLRSALEMLPALTGLVVLLALAIGGLR